ncbi:hypothetical protein A9Q99_15315 [Gammaproteobacteria bacterium 45_16_T64]|nr:hypothetical protein A9Q99_15315 [Gammaproteobacteria bacterium 45_16_T64]
MLDSLPMSTLHIIRRTLRLLPLVSAIAIGMSSNSSYGLTVNTRIHTGYDSNPLTLADKFDPDGGTYVQLKSTAKQKIVKGLSAKVKVKAKRFGGSLNDADTTRTELSLNYRSKIGEKKKSRIQLELAAGTYDKTFVSHVTGVVGVTNNQEIGDRYDYQWWSTSATLSRKISRALNANFGFEFLKKDYEDYTHLNQSDFDHKQITFSSRWRYRLSKSHRSIFNIGLSHRAYDDKREVNLSADPIAGTDLTYTHQFANLSHRYKLSRYLTLEGKLSYFDQQDGGEGYYDYTRYAIQVAARYRVMSLSNLQAKVKYQEDGYKRDSQVLNNNVVEEERLSERKGTTASLRFETRLPFKMLLSKRKAKKYPTTFVQLTRYQFDADDENYTYDRQQIEAGVFFHF